MIKYHFIDDEIEYISAEDQCWDEKTLAQLRSEHNVFFCSSGDGVIPVKVIQTKHSPGIALGIEDDGTIAFDRCYGGYTHSFSYHWLDALICDLKAAREFCVSLTNNTGGLKHG